jgi:hypothetical protein
MHETEARLIKKYKETDNTIIENEEIEIEKIITRYRMAIEYASKIINQEERPIRSEWNNAYKDLIFDGITNSDRINTLSLYKNETREIIIKINNEISVGGENSTNDRIKSKTLSKLLNIFRHWIVKINNQTISILKGYWMKKLSIPQRSQ